MEMSFFQSLITRKKLKNLKAMEKIQENQLEVGKNYYIKLNIPPSPYHSGYKKDVWGELVSKFEVDGIWYFEIKTDKSIALQGFRVEYITEFSSF